MRKILFIFLGLLSAIFISELLLRLDPKYRFDSLTGWTHSVTSEYHAKCYRPSKILGLELIPGSCDRINSLGMYDKSYSMEKPGNAYRILLLGDSITERGAWSSIIEERLNSQGHFEILNCGVSAWGLVNYYRYLKYKGLKLEPDMVLIGFCLNDLSKALVYIYTDKKKKEMKLFTIENSKGSDFSVKVNPGLFRYSFLYRFLFINVIKGADPAKRDDKTCVQMLSEMKMMANGNIYAVIFPYLKPLEQYSGSENAEYTDLISALENTGIEYLDLHDHFNRFSDAQLISYRIFPEDQIHFNEEANEIKANVIYSWLLEKIKKAGVDRPDVQ
ncbi:MAG: SGNH/GDSL hydrolase family protein [Elusimicrobia bacterium]|nr:SGNH/GDSL hydrolase family protein [Elusimicrobiota bacterium]